MKASKDDSLILKGRRKIYLIQSIFENNIQKILIGPLFC